MRLFVALGISAKVRANLTALISDLRSAESKLRWMNPNNLHLTLKFIGEVPAPQLPEIEAQLAQARVPQAAELIFKGLGFFPDERRPSILWVGVQTNEHVAALVKQIDEALVKGKVAREEKTFVPHLTIGRFRETRISPALRSAMEKWEQHEFGRSTVNEFQLMQSTLQSSGAEHKVLHTFEFARNPCEGTNL
jgi:2'-5' RNA ligase